MKKEIEKYEPNKVIRNLQNTEQGLVIAPMSNRAGKASEGQHNDKALTQRFLNCGVGTTADTPAFFRRYASAFLVRFQVLCKTSS